MKNITNNFIHKFLTHMNYLKEKQLKISIKFSSVSSRVAKCIPELDGQN